MESSSPKRLFRLADLRTTLLLVTVFYIIATSTATRPVNISEAWFLPQVGFPVFYRYFRDRVSWQEAETVCRFHHATLVSVADDVQFDALRDYFAELDVTNIAWIGLSKKANADKSRFFWSGSKPLSGEGHWQEAIPVGGDPLCVAVDPTANFLWKPLSCAGPDVASFVCEHPVPSWLNFTHPCLKPDSTLVITMYMPDKLSLHQIVDCKDADDEIKNVICREKEDENEIIRKMTCTTKRVVFKRLNRTQTVIKPWFIRDTWPGRAPARYIEEEAGIDANISRHRRDTISPKRVSETSTEPLVSSIIINVENDSLSDDIHSETSNLYPHAAMIIILKNISSLVNGSELDWETSTRYDALYSSSSSEAPAVDYPSAISQGQLFSIIDNGTMFDIIELNDTIASEPALESPPSTESTQSVTVTAYDESSPTPSTPNAASSTTDDPSMKRRPPLKSNTHQSNLKSLNSGGVNKELSLFPRLDDATAHKEPPLNRTDRKYPPPQIINNRTTNTTKEHHLVDIHLENKSDKNFTLATYRHRIELVEPTATAHPAVAAAMVSVESSNTMSPTEKQLAITTSELTFESTTLKYAQSTTEPPPPYTHKPNRKRQLIRPQRRSTYAYIIRRMLG